MVHKGSGLRALKIKNIINELVNEEAVRKPGGAEEHVA